MTLEKLGFDDYFKEFVNLENIGDFVIGRISREYKEKYLVRTTIGEYEAEITGNMRFSATSRIDFPAVGDFVKVMVYDDGTVIIHKIISRKTVLERRAVGVYGDVQILATNIDTALIIQAFDRDYNLNRLERYIAVCNSGGVKPVILFSKSDLVDDSLLEEKLKEIKTRFKNIDIITFSNISGKGLNDILKIIISGKTYCIIGSSGVGKSTLINNLLEEDLLETSEISESSDRGKHTTTHRELIVMKDGGILIDTPGIREIGVFDTKSGVEKTFEDIHELSKSCKFIDCTHSGEPECAITNALEQGELDKDKFKNYLKMKRESQWAESTIVEKRAKDKEFGKMVKSVISQKKKRKF